MYKSIKKFCVWVIWKSPFIAFGLVQLLNLDYAGLFSGSLNSLAAWGMIALILVRKWDMHVGYQQDFPDLERLAADRKFRPSIIEYLVPLVSSLLMAAGITCIIYFINQPLEALASLIVTKFCLLLIDGLGVKHRSLTSKRYPLSDNGDLKQIAAIHQEFWDYDFHTIRLAKFSVFLCSGMLVIAIGVTSGWPVWLSFAAAITISETGDRWNETMMSRRRDWRERRFEQVKAL